MVEKCRHLPFSISIMDNHYKLKKETRRDETRRHDTTQCFPIYERRNNGKKEINCLLPGSYKLKVVLI